MYVRLICDKTIPLLLTFIKPSFCIFFNILQFLSVFTPRVDALTHLNNFAKKKMTLTEY